MPTYKYTDQTKTVVHIIEEDGKSYGSMLASQVPEKTPDGKPIVILPWSVSLAEWKTFVKERATQKREQVESGGTVVNGTPVKTDEVSQGKINRALSIVGRNPTKAIPFKSANGTFASLNKAQIEAIADAVGDFVVSCYAAEATHYAAIDALLTVLACENYYDNILNTGWPSNGN